MAPPSTVSYPPVEEFTLYRRTVADARIREVAAAGAGAAAGAEAGASTVAGAEETFLGSLGALYRRASELSVPLLLPPNREPRVDIDACCFVSRLMIGLFAG